MVYIVEPQGVQADENGALLDKKPKRIHKTPKQLIALENFYNGMRFICCFIFRSDKFCPFTYDWAIGLCFISNESKIVETLFIYA